jgi:hypothetical protein
MKRVLILASLLVSTSVFANDVDPFGFEKQQSIGSTSRAEVVADLKLAQQQGQLPVGELGVKPIDAPSIKSRAQVAAETREAARLGLLRHGVLGPVQATVEQEQQITLAGLRAISHSAATE